MTGHVPSGFLLERGSHFVALGFGSGLAPRAPGTVGTLVGFPVFMLLAPLSWSVQFAALSAMFLVGGVVCGAAGRALGVPDHGSIVWDEIVAFALVLTITPISVSGWLAAFLLFRFFDIVKPWPISVVDERLKNGFGVMLDDLLAAVLAMGVIALVDARFPSILHI